MESTQLHALPSLGPDPVLASDHYPRIPNPFECLRQNLSDNLLTNLRPFGDTFIVAEKLGSPVADK